MFIWPRSIYLKVHFHACTLSYIIDTRLVESCDEAFEYTDLWILGYWYGALVLDDRKQSEYSHVISYPAPRHRHSGTSFLFEHSDHSAETGDSSLPHRNFLSEGVYFLLAVNSEKRPQPAYKPDGQDERSLRTGAVSLPPPAYTYTYIKEILETNRWKMQAEQCTPRLPLQQSLGLEIGDDEYPR